MTSSEVAFIGDIHGNLSALEDLVGKIRERAKMKIVLLGDYINHGPDSAGVLDFISTRSKELDLVPLRGNHEQYLLDAIIAGDATNFIISGGAATVRSYTDQLSPPNFVDFLRGIVPKSHVQLLQSMPERYETEEFVAQHALPDDNDGRFLVCGHTRVANYPKISERSAFLDTGSGFEGGSLSSMIWPSLDTITV